MDSIKTDLSKFDNTKYQHGASKWKYMLWHLTSVLFFINPLSPSSGLKVWLLRKFGASIGSGVVMNKPNIKIKYPWLLTIGDYTWLGEDAWIYNMAPIVIGSHVNISQGALLLTGNHNYKSSEFEVFTAPIRIEDGVFIGANATVCPGVTCKSHSVLAVGGIATKDLEPYTIYAGNPAIPVRKRQILA